MSIYNDRAKNSYESGTTVHPVNYSKWFLRLLTWDGIVPAIMLALPGFARRFGPQNNDRFLVMLVVAALIAGILLRFSFGMRHINANHCGPVVKQVQRIGLCLMIFMLMLVETLICVIPNPNADLKLADFVFFATVGSVYLLVMGCVLYPGRRVSDE